MQVEQIKLDRKEARDLYRAYKAHQHYSEPIDHEIQRAYQLIAQGRMVIRAVESIARAGLGPDNLPKLALTRADNKKCFFIPNTNGGGRFKKDSSWSDRRGARDVIHVPAGTWPNLANQRFSYEAIVPIVPIHLRPKRGMANYHILWEAEWSKVVPIDPMLLRQIGKGDMWLVVAAWDLTEVERAALSTRMNA